MAIGRTRGGLSRKIHIAVDTLEHPLQLVLMAGEVHESTLCGVVLATHWVLQKPLRAGFQHCPPVVSHRRFLLTVAFLPPVGRPVP